MTSPSKTVADAPVQKRALRLGFVGVGWIGQHRMNTLLDSGIASAAAIAEPVTERAEAAKDRAPESPRLYDDLDGLLAEDLDGVVIATPSALHADQAIRALEAELPVFCQKPLGRTAAETRRVIDAARREDRLLGVDFSYRQTNGMQEVHRLVQNGAIGDVYAADLVFHNAYGPDKDWFYDPSKSGGGCVIDLGIHLIDLGLWTLGFPAVESVTSHLVAEGQPLATPDEQVEDYATARVNLDTGTSLRLACSWNLPAGQSAVIEATFYGTDGGLVFQNVDGSFYDFQVVRLNGTDRTVLVEPPDRWGGRAAVDWARQALHSPGFDASIEQVSEVATIIDAIYNRPPSSK